MDDNNNTCDTFNDERQFDNFCSQKEFCLALNEFCFLRNVKKVILSHFGKIRGHYKMLWEVKNFKKCNMTPLQFKHKRVIADSMS